MNVSAATLLGAWNLVDWQIETLDSGHISWPFGQDAQGLLLYAPSGWMSATLSQRVRTPLSASSVRQSDSASRAQIAGEYLAYSGRWSLEGNQVTHVVSLSLNPVLLGTRQQRDISFSGVDLVLSATETAGGLSRVHRLRWRRD